MTKPEEVEPIPLRERDGKTFEKKIIEVLPTNNTHLSLADQHQIQDQHEEINPFINYHQETDGPIDDKKSQSPRAGAPSPHSQKVRVFDQTFIQTQHETEDQLRTFDIAWSLKRLKGFLSRLEGSTFSVYFAMILAQFSWSSTHINLRVLVNYINPIMVPFIRSLFTAPIIGIYAYYHHRANWITKEFVIKNYKILLVYGLTGSILNNIFFNIGLLLTSASDGGLLQPGIPVFTLLLSLLFKMEKFSSLKLLSVGFAIAGCTAIVIGEEYLGPSASVDSVLVSHSAGERVMGLLCFLLQTFIFAIYIIMQKRANGDNRWPTPMPPVVCTFYTFLFGFPINLVISFFVVNTVPWSSLPWGTICFAISWIILIGTVLAFTVFSYATNHLPASVASMSITLQPFLSPLFGFLILNESLTYLHGVGGFLIICGVSLSVFARQRELKNANQTIPIIKNETDINDLSNNDHITDNTMDENTIYVEEVSETNDYDKNCFEEKNNEVNPFLQSTTPS